MDHMKELLEYCENNNFERYKQFINNHNITPNKECLDIASKNKPCYMNSKKSIDNNIEMIIENDGVPAFDFFITNLNNFLDNIFTNSNPYFSGLISDTGESEFIYFKDLNYRKKPLINIEMDNFDKMKLI